MKRAPIRKTGVLPAAARNRNALRRHARSPIRSHEEWRSAFQKS
jgi:hypothetical protein